MGVARVFRAGSPFNGVELDEIDFEQTADTMYIAHIDHEPTKLVRSAHDSWTFSSVEFGPQLAAPTGVAVAATNPNVDAANGGDAYFPQLANYVVTAIDASGSESRASSNVNASNDLTLKRNYNLVTWDSVTGADRYAIYKSQNSQFVGYIGSTASLSFVDDNIGPAFDNAPPELYEPFANVDDYPSTVTFFEQRLIYGRTRNNPNAIWGSRAAQFENFDQSTPLRADDSFSIAVLAGRVNAVNQLVSTTSLLALTSDSIFKIDGSAGTGFIEASPPPSARRQVGRGCSRLSPLVVDTVVFYTPSVGAGVRTINYSFEIDGLKSDDVSIFSPHFFEGHSIVSWCYAQEPNSLVWAVRDDGKLLCFTWEQAQQVWGWTLCETDGVALSCCAISESGEDRVYLIVRRTINGVERTFIERMASAYWNSAAGTCFLDCAISYSYETPRRTFYNIWHLEGHTVWGIVDGMVIKDLIVSNGTIILPDSVDEAYQATFGLPFDVDIQTNPVAFQGQTGSVAGRKQQPGEVVLHLMRSRGVKVGAARPDVTEPTTYELKPRLSEAWGAADDLLDGKYVADVPNVVSGESAVYIKQTDPLPLTLLGIYMDPVIGS